MGDTDGNLTSTQATTTTTTSTDARGVMNSSTMNASIFATSWTSTTPISDAWDDLDDTNETMDYNSSEIVDLDSVLEGEMNITESTGLEGPSAWEINLTELASSGIDSVIDSNVSDEPNETELNGSAFLELSGFNSTEEEVIRTALLD